MTTQSARSYRFGDASRPGVLLGLSARQAVPLVAGVMWLAVCLQTPLALPAGLPGLAAAAAIAFGRWHGTPFAEILAPSIRLLLLQQSGRRRWLRRDLRPWSQADRSDLPPVLAGLEILDASAPPGLAGGSNDLAVVHDRRGGTLTATIRVSGRGFPLAPGTAQDGILAMWGNASGPFARERSPITRITWQEWARATGSTDHSEFLSSTGAPRRSHEPATADYLALVQQQAQRSMHHETIVSITLDRRRLRTRAPRTERLQAAVSRLLDEVRLFALRLETAGLDVRGPLTTADLAAVIRERTDPRTAAQAGMLGNSLATAAGHVDAEWAPMAVEPSWGSLRVDGAIHRIYRIAAWPQLPVPADWMTSLLTEPHVSRSVVLIMEPVPLSHSARTADREAMAREADADSKGRRGFRVSAKERKRLAEVEAREHELAQGHAEFRYVGLVDVCAPDDAALEDASSTIEQAAAQSLLDLRALEARHDLGWVACLPLGRTVASTRGGGR